MLDQMMNIVTLLYGFGMVFYSMLTLYGNMKSERRINRALHKVVAQNNKIRHRFKEVSTKLKSGQEVDHRELIDCIRLIEQAALVLDQADRLTVLEGLHHPEEKKRLAYLADLLGRVSASPPAPSPNNKKESKVDRIWRSLRFG